MVAKSKHHLKTKPQVGEPQQTLKNTQGAILQLTEPFR